MMLYPSINAVLKRTASSSQRHITLTIFRSQGVANHHQIVPIQSSFHNGFIRPAISVHNSRYISYISVHAAMRQEFRPQGLLVSCRRFSDKSSGEETTTDIVLTPGQKVQAGVTLTMWAGAAVLATVCGYYIINELLPTKMSANVVFDRAFDLIKENPGIVNRFGAPLKAYGRDHGGRREGRRNFVENREYPDKNDGSKRTAVRFNLEGQYGHAFVFAEVSNKMPSGDFVYVLVQDKRNGHTISIVDNRAALAAQQMAGDSKEGQEAFANLLGWKK